MSNATAWDNRIVEYDPAVPLDQLLAHPRNPKIHPRPQTDALKGILGEVGWLTGLIVNTTTGHVLDGHDRIKAAMEAGQSTAPVFYVAVPEDQEPYILATFDPVGTLAATDSTILTDLLKEVSSADSAVQALLASLVTEPEVLPTPGAGGDEFDATPGSGDPRVQPGDLWALGPHRLLCGDSTDPLAIERVLDGKRPALLIADPPYGMAYEPNHDDRRTKSHYNGAGYHNVKQQGMIAGDNEDFDPTFLMELFRDVREQFWWGADYYADRIPNRLKGSWLVWDKRAGIEDMDFNTSHFELCWSKARHLREILRVKWFGIQGTERQDVRQRVHPTQKPLEIYTPLIEQHSQPGDMVFSPYMGSGPELIAAHRTGRVAYGLEIEPRYCDVILRRAEAEGIGPIERIAP